MEAWGKELNLSGSNRKFFSICAAWPSDDSNYIASAEHANGFFKRSMASVAVRTADNLQEFSLLLDGYKSQALSHPANALDSPSD